MNKRSITGILALAVSLIFGSTLVAFAAVPSQKMQFEKFNGVIQNVNTTHNGVLVQYHKNKMNFSVNGKTKIYEGNKALALSKLNKGMWASVQYNKEGNEMIAQVIRVSAVQEPKPMTSSGTITKSQNKTTTQNQNKMTGSEKSATMK